jgi:hypothetical protein
LPHGLRDFRALEEAVAYAHKQMVPWTEAWVRQVGAAQVEMQMHRHDTQVLDGGDREDKPVLGTELTFTAVG